eukprot:scaffold250610_cov30-Tisochrysis_lutea.AAC.18
MCPSQKPSQEQHPPSLRIRARGVAAAADPSPRPQRARWRRICCRTSQRDERRRPNGCALQVDRHPEMPEAAPIAKWVPR